MRGALAAILVAFILFGFVLPHTDIPHKSDMQDKNYTIYIDEETGMATITTKYYNVHQSDNRLVIYGEPNSEVNDAE